MRAKSLFSAGILCLCGIPTFAATVTKVNDDALRPLREPGIARKIRLDRLPIYGKTQSIVELEEFQVWAPGGKVVVHGDNGVVLKTFDPPPMRYYRGSVNADPESFAYLAVDSSRRSIQGLIVTRDKRFTVATVRQRRVGARGHLEESDDTFLTELDDSDNLAAPPRKWECAADGTQVDGAAAVHHVIGPDGQPIAPQGITGTQSYAMTVEIETDYELYVNAGGNPAAVTAITNYITNLTGAVSTIYNRDLQTNVTQTNINIYTTAADPWVQTDGGSACLNEIGDVYHNVALKPAGRTSSAVVMLSGKDTGSGIAWLHVICGTDFSVAGGHFGGPYAFCGSIGVGGLATVPNPDATIDGIVKGMPSYDFMLTDGSQTYWPLAEYAHELGHNLAGQHTHCVAISDAERVAAGFTDGSTANFVDHCYGAGGAGCYSGPNYQAGSQGVFHGTIMGYCHNLFGGSSGAFPQSRFTFGQAVEPSHHELDDYMLRAAGPINGGTNIVNGVGAFTMSAITAPASLGASSTGNAASVTATPSAGATYAWTIANGTITSASNTSSVTFTAGATGSVILRATAYGTNRCGITDTKAVPIASINPPANVVAAATTINNVHVTWNTVIGATAYHIYRLARLGQSYAQVGTANGQATSSFDDGTAAASTSYLYRVRAFDGTSESGDSNADLATTVIFTDSTITPGVTAVKVAHIAELRTAVTAVRFLAAGGPQPFTDDPLDTTIAIKALHITELRANLTDTRADLGQSAMVFTYPTLTPMSTLVHAADINELRAGVQ